MQVTRHFVEIGKRRVHYRRCGQGPALLMVHQSPRSSAEYEALMREWGAHFTCIAPDSPGFGQSDPLTDPGEIDEFADSLIELLDALGLDRVGAYGEHLTWLWNRVIEQSWFFPRFAVTPEARVSVAHGDPAKVDATVRDFLDSGDAYRAGYGAVLRAARDIPAPDAVTPPVRITAYVGDPLQAHIARLGVMPANWSGEPVPTPAAHPAASLAILRSGTGAARNYLVALQSKEGNI